jgi:SAM-dependent methyltransferase
MEDSSTRSWEQLAEEWAGQAPVNDYRNIFLMPQTFALLGDVAGRRILDVGCGEGGYSRRLAQQGAQVTGIDGSPTLIEFARQRATQEQVAVTHETRNANSLDGLADESFDLALAAMSLMDVEDYGGAAREIHRVLRPGGELLMSITHPCFDGRGSRWHKVDGEYLHYAVDNYSVSEAWEDFINDQFTRPVLFRHQPLQDFISPLLALGFRLTLFHEPTATLEQIRQAPRLARLKRVALFLFMKWLKPLI